MNEKHSGNVGAALDLLLEEIGGYLGEVRGMGAKALTDGDNIGAKTAIQFAEDIEGFLYRIRQLKDDWSEMVGQDRRRPALFPGPSTGTNKRKEMPKPKKSYGSVSAGKKTPQKDYFIPILRALDRLGGSARMQDVIDLVGEMMKDKLKPTDFEPLKSDAKAIRWVNTAQWARLELVNSGLMKSGSPHGIWEISERGRRHLEKHNAKI